MGLEQLIPLGHSLHLMLFASMSTAISNVSFGPFFESGGDLLDSFTWIILIVSQIIIIFGISSNSWATVGKAWIIEATFVIGNDHTLGITLKLGNPAILRGKLIEPFVQDFLGKGQELVEALRRST